MAGSVLREVFAAAARSVEGANPLPMTGYKAALLVGTVTSAPPVLPR